MSEFHAGDEPEPQQPQFDVLISPELEGGVYANFVTVWHSPFEFTLDFCATLPARPGTDEDESPVVVPARVTSRVKIPVTLLFNLLQALNENMTIYEATFGEIRRPGEDEEAE